jgi:bifunctional DNase/RNase
MTQADSPQKRKISRAVVKAVKIKGKVRATKAASSKMVEFFVFGITLGSNQRRPVLILKDSTGQLTLPVWLNPIDASYAMNDIAHQAYAAQSVTLKMLQAFQLRLERCVFGDLKGHHQFVELQFSGNPRLTKIASRADEAMSLCLALGARFFATSEFVARCRDVDAEIASLEVGLNMKPEIGSKNHRYVM